MAETPDDQVRRVTGRRACDPCRICGAACDADHSVQIYCAHGLKRPMGVHEWDSSHRHDRYPHGHRSSGVPQRDRTYREGLVPAKFVRDQWGRMVKKLFSRWQVEADCMANDEKHRQRWMHYKWERMVKKLFSRRQAEADCMANDEDHEPWFVIVPATVQVQGI